LQSQEQNILEVPLEAVVVGIPFQKEGNVILKFLSHATVCWKKANPNSQRDQT